MSGALTALVGSAGGAPGVINGALPNASSSAGAAALELQNDGDCVVSNGAGVSTVDWVSPSDTVTAAFYEAKVDNTGGAAFDSGTTGTWLDLATTRSWTVNSGTAVFTLSIREKATGIVRTTQTGKTLTAP